MHALRSHVFAMMAVLWLAAPASAETIAIIGGKVFPVSGPPLDEGTVIVTDATITAVGTTVPVPPGARVIDAKGRWVTPGLIDAATALGVVEIEAVPETRDIAAKGERGVAAAFRVWEGLNPGSVLWGPTRQEGVTQVAIVPSEGFVSGQAALVETVEGTSAEMVRRAPIAMAADLGSASSAEASARGELLMRMRELLEDARAYAARRTAFESGNTRDFAVGRLHLDALGPVVAGKLPLLVKVDRASDIDAVLGLAAEHKLRLVILGGAEAWRVAKRLADARVPVITEALNNLPASFAELGSRQENAALLRQAGVTVALTAGPGEAFNVRNIRQHAGNAVAYGMTWDDALRAVTLSPAEIYGAGATTGSLQPGRDANIVVWDGDPFEFATRAVHVFIRGREAPATPTRQDELTERYKVKSGAL